jgi:long-chain acyl-CoA synthetase
MDLSFIRGFFGGAAPLAPETVRQLFDLTGKRIYDVYGLTENTALATCTPWKGKVKPGTVGVPLPNTDLKIVDLETGTKEMPAGEAGEICIQGPQLMTGYYKKPEETKNALRDGWLYTGDIGFLDEDGHLTIVDRKKDMIISGGFNVYPREIEDVIATHPSVATVAVVGVPDEKWGEAVKAVVVLRDGATVDIDELIAFVKERKGSHHAPKSVDVVDSLPLSPLGKPDKKALRERYWGAGDRRVN